MTIESLLPASELMLDPGVVHLQTGSVGATPRSVFDASVAAWRRLEQVPAEETYGGGIARLDEVRTSAARFLGCSRDEMVLTSSTTAGMFMAAQGLDLAPGDRILTTGQEHPGGRLGWSWLQRRAGIEIDEIAIPGDAADPQDIVDLFEQAITPRTRVISFSHIFYTTGMLAPAERICALARSRGCISVVDGAQAIGAIPLDLKKLGCDVYAASGHKWLLGPKGTGLLYIDRALGDAVDAMALQSGRRANSDGTGIANIVGYFGLGAAISAIDAIGLDRIVAHNLELRKYAREALSQISGIRTVGSPNPQLVSAALTFTLPSGTDARAVRQSLAADHGIFVKLVVTPMLTALRISPHLYNDESDIRRLVEALERIVSA